MLTKEERETLKQSFEFRRGNSVIYNGEDIHAAYFAGAEALARIRAEKTEPHKQVWACHGMGDANCGGNHTQDDEQCAGKTNRYPGSFAEFWMRRNSVRVPFNSLKTEEDRALRVWTYAVSRGVAIAKDAARKEERERCANAVMGELRGCLKGTKSKRLGTYLSSFASGIRFEILNPEEDSK